MNHQNATIVPRLTNPLLPIVSSSLRLSPETWDPAPTRPGLGRFSRSPPTRSFASDASGSGAYAYNPGQNPARRRHDGARRSHPGSRRRPRGRRETGPRQRAAPARRELMAVPRFGLNRFDARSVDAFAADVRRAEG